MARTNHRKAASKNSMTANDNDNDNDEVTSTSSSEAAAAAEGDDVSGSERGDDDDAAADDDDEMEPSDDDDEDVNVDASSSGSSDDDESDDDNDDDESEDDDDDDDDDDASQQINLLPTTDNTHEPCTFDLANLLAFNTHQINAAELYQKQQQQSSSKAQLNNQECYSSPPTITAPAANSISVNESLLLAKAAEGTTQLLRELWRLPKEKTDVGLLAKLPSLSSAETKLPRSLVRIL